MAKLILKAEVLHQQIPLQGYKATLQGLLQRLFQQLTITKMKKVFTTALVASLLLGFASSCNQQEPQPENQVVENVQPSNDLTETTAASSISNARVAATATQQMFKFNTQVVGYSQRKIYSVDASKLFNARYNLVRSYTTSGQIDLSVCYLNSKGLYVSVGTKSTSGPLQEVRFHKSEIVGNTAYVIVNGGKANSNFDVAFYMLSDSFPETAVKKKTDSSPYSGFFSIPGECVWYEYIRIQELADLGYISQTSADYITAKLKGKSNRNARTWPGFIGGTWIAESPLPNKSRRKGLIGVYQTASGTGHIFFVESVSEDLKTYTISEYNWPSGQKYGTRTLTFGKDQGLGVHPTFFELEVTN